MASIMKRGNTYSVRYNYKDHAGKPCKGWETFNRVWRSAKETCL